MKRDSELYPYRRHLRTCVHFGPGGREIRLDKCRCPFHVDGIHNDQRVRQSLRTRSRQLADRRLADLLRKLDSEADEHDGEECATASNIQSPGPGVTPAASRTVADAVTRYLQALGSVSEDGKYRGDVEFATWRKYRNTLTLFASFCVVRQISALTQVTMDVIEDFRATREIKPITWRVELQALRTFFSHAVIHQWIPSNPAREVKGPRITKLNDVVPYTREEECRILTACDEIGPHHYKKWAMYERLRSRGMVLTLRHTALRVVDVATLRKDAVSWDAQKSTWRIFLRTQKSGEPVFLPIPETMKHALDAVPTPRGADRDCPYFFWNGKTSRRAVVGIAERSLSAVFRRSGVKDAGAHRYRHTLATWLLAEKDATFEQVADILGNSPDVVRKHYAKWAKGRQDRIDGLMLAHFRTLGATNSVTKKSHEETAPVN